LKILKPRFLTEAGLRCFSSLEALRPGRTWP